MCSTVHLRTLLTVQLHTFTVHLRHTIIHAEFEFLQVSFVSPRRIDSRCALLVSELMTSELVAVFCLAKGRRTLAEPVANAVRCTIFLLPQQGALVLVSTQARSTGQVCARQTDRPRYQAECFQRETWAQGPSACSGIGRGFGIGSRPVDHLPDQSQDIQRHLQSQSQTFFRA